MRVNLRHKPVLRDSLDGEDASGIGLPQRTEAALDKAILKLLAPEPMMKWKLRQMLHEPERYIEVRLRALRAKGLVKVVGKVAEKRAWALSSYYPPIASNITAKPMNRDIGLHLRKSKTPESSWWTTAPQAGMTARAKQEFEGR